MHLILGLEEEIPLTNMPSPYFISRFAQHAPQALLKLRTILQTHFVNVIIHSFQVRDLSIEEMRERSIYQNVLTFLSEVKLLSRVRLFVTLWTTAHQAPPSMGFSRQEY